MDTSWNRFLNKHAVAICMIVTVFVSGHTVLHAKEIGAGLSASEKTKRVNRTIQAVQRTLKFALDRLEKARENKDIIQVNCVNDKLTGIRGFLKIAERSKKSLDQAKRQDDANLMQHEFAKVVLIGQRVDNLKLQVEGCVGEISQYTGNSQLTLEVDPDIRSDNPATTEAVPTFDALNTARPPAVSGSE